MVPARVFKIDVADWQHSSMEIYIKWEQWGTSIIWPRNWLP